MKANDSENQNLTPEETSPVETDIAGNDNLTPDTSNDASEGLETHKEEEALVLTEGERVALSVLPSARGSLWRNMGETESLTLMATAVLLVVIVVASLIQLLWGSPVPVHSTVGEMCDFWYVPARYHDSGGTFEQIVANARADGMAWKIGTKYCVVG